MDIKKGDKVVVIQGDDRGRQGEVQRVLSRQVGQGPPKAGEPKPDGDRVVVAGINLIKKHQRRTGNVNTQFGIIEREAPIHISNVVLDLPEVRQADPGGASGAMPMAAAAASARSAAK